MHLAATIERAEKQIILATHARRLLHLLDDTPVVPGDERQPFEHELEARQILNEAESDLRAWEPTVEAIPTNAGDLGTNLMVKPEALETAALGEEGAGLPARGENATSTQPESAQRANVEDEATAIETKEPQTLSANDPVTAAS